VNLKGMHIQTGVFDFYTTNRGKKELPRKEASFEKGNECWSRIKNPAGVVRRYEARIEKTRVIDEQKLEREWRLVELKVRIVA
jgi:hypothetical protein